MTIQKYDWVSIRYKAYCKWVKCPFNSTSALVGQIEKKNKQYFHRDIERDGTGNAMLMCNVTVSI